MSTHSPESFDQISRFIALGSAALEDRSSDTAVQYFVISLHHLLQHPEHPPRMLALILFNLGKALGYGFKSVNTAIACCEACADLSRSVSRAESETDRIYMAATVVLILEEFASARRMLQIALDRYRSIGALAKVRLVQTELRDIVSRLGEKHYRQLSETPAPTRPHSLLISHGGLPVYRLTIGRDGRLINETLATLTPDDEPRGWHIESVTG
jgi:hypothetical protein